jgi:hypothetical protein
MCWSQNFGIQKVYTRGDEVLEGLCQVILFDLRMPDIANFPACHTSEVFIS